MTDTWSVQLTDDGKLRVVYRDEDGKRLVEDLNDEEAIALVRSLLRRGRPHFARIVLDAWFVWMANAAGFMEYEFR